MELDDRESTDSGSLSGNQESESPPLNGGGIYADHAAVAAAAAAAGGVVPPGVINMNISMEAGAAGVNSPPAVEMGGGAVVGSGGSGVLGGGGNGDSALGKKKRGRPRKYDADGNLNPAYRKTPAAVVAAAATAALPQQGGFTLSTPPSYEHSSGSKRGRAKNPPGSCNWLLASLGELFTNTAGGDFTPHVVTVHTGEDVAGKILTFAQKGHRGICVLSANGSVSNVTLRQPGSSGGLLTYEGRFEILTLTGSYTISDNNGMKSRSGGLSVSLASPDGRVIGGGVAGSLMAANPIQVVVGSFIPNGYTVPVQKRKYNRAEPKNVPIAHQNAPATVTAATPLSQAPPETTIYPIQASQFPVQNPAKPDNSLSNKDLPNSASTDTGDWNSSGEPSSNQRPYPDINISIPLEEN